MKIIVLFLLTFFLSTNLLAKNTLEISGYANVTQKGAKIGAAYLKIKNLTNKDIIFTEAMSNHAKHVEFHTHKHVGDLMKMEQLKVLLVPAGKTITMKPGGIHLMLINLTKKLNVGKSLRVGIKDNSGNTYSQTLLIKDFN
jgi:copper(I)-binding protein